MNLKGQIIRVIDHLKIEEKNFLDNWSNKQEEFPRSNENWSYLDIIAHNSEWRNITLAKLQRIQRNEPVEFRENLDLLNREIYRRYQHLTNSSANELSRLSIDSLLEHIQTLDDFEFHEEGKLSGFMGPLWRFIVYYGFIHPMKHIIFHYFGKQDFLTAYQILKNNYLLFTDSDSLLEMEQIFFNYAEYLDELVNRDEVLSGFKHFVRSQLEDDVLSEDLLQHFLIGSKQ